MWLHTTTADERRALLATYLGYGLDGFDLMIYSFMIPSLLTLWGMSAAEAGHIASGALITSALGGGCARGSIWTRAHFAAYGAVVRGVHLPKRFHALIRPAAFHPGDAGIRLRRRMGGGLGAGGRNHRCASSRQGHRPRAKQLVIGLGGGRTGVLGGEFSVAAVNRVAGGFLAGHPAGVSGDLHPPPSAGAGDLCADARAACNSA